MGIVEGVGFSIGAPPRRKYIPEGGARHGAGIQD